MFQCSTGEEYLPFFALCNGTNECSSGADETNVFCASEYKHTIVLNIHCLLLAQQVLTTLLWKLPIQRGVHCTKNI